MRGGGICCTASGFDITADLYHQHGRAVEYVMRSARQELPRAIARAVLANLRESMVPMLYSTIAPTAYVVYLHPDDFALVEDVVPLIANQIDHAIDEAIASLNDRGSWQRIVRLVRKPLPPVEA